MRNNILTLIKFRYIKIILIKHSAAMGAAYRALAGAEKSEKSFHEITKNSADLVKIASPNKTRTAHYKRQGFFMLFSDYFRNF